jgi:hypothetical protein
MKNVIFPVLEFWVGGIHEERDCISYSALCVGEGEGYRNLDTIASNRWQLGGNEYSYQLDVLYPLC